MRRSILSERIDKLTSVRIRSLARGELWNALLDGLATTRGWLSLLKQEVVTPSLWMVRLKQAGEISDYAPWRWY